MSDIIVEYPPATAGNPKVTKLVSCIRDLLVCGLCCFIAAGIFVIPLTFVIINRNPVDPEVFLCFGLNSTQSSVCSSNGNCTALNQCNCTLGYVGVVCQFVTCFGKNITDRTMCSGNGTCVAYNQCSCRNGRSGAACEL
jgi:hypothetical protein